jgi:hypothetical protein
VILKNVIRSISRKCYYIIEDITDTYVVKIISTANFTKSARVAVGTQEGLS